MSFQIRQATILDLDMLAPLFDGYRQFYGQPADLARAHDFLAERFRHHESLILLARDEQGEGLGFTQLYPLFSSVRTVRTWLLNDLFVVSSARRQGVAAALLTAAADHARALGAASLALSTALDNAPAQALYESLGWQRDRQFCEYGLTL
ncbi:GNAT family N-acetyltransferase [Rhodanobacter sp. C05]|uniref:GNAT family N-acetyltransferase n=1 Tax=Rhodanobacter sp. C05 TaxID=1945855 RepID=UPI00098706BC|nr:GNAT family N-acetyltransferase [Rhodanobacter sp. C05]OOG40732.1 GNAT family N-acetyltransferase [Rhodanobacter sp. C05]